MKINGRRYLGTNEKTRRQQWEDFTWHGLFHQWGVQSVEDREGNMNNTMAIVEDSSGKVHMVEPEFVQFES